MEEHERKCTTGGWGAPQKTSGRKFVPPVWPAVYLWLLVGVIYIISKLF